MIDVTIWHYDLISGRILRFSKKLKLPSVPVIGSEIEMVDGNYTVSRVVFSEEKGVLLISKSDNNYENINIHTFIEEMEEDYGWKLISNVKNRDMLVQHMEY